MMTYIEQLFVKAQMAMQSDEEGQGLVEYALIIALVAIVLVTALGALEGGIAGAFTRITTALAPAA